MGLNDRFVKVERKFAWSFYGFILAVIFGAFSVYTVYFKDLNPSLIFNIETNTKVLDIKENVRKLDIMYNNENIKESGKNLTIIKLRIENSSDVNILSTFYDPLDELGFRLKNAEIVEKPQVVESSNEYIAKNLKLHLDSIGNVKFNPIIIDGRESFTLKILALHRTNETPLVQPFGKIAGVQEFSVIETYKSLEEKTFLNSLFTGGFWVHVVRFVMYILIMAVVALVIGIPTFLISEVITERRRKRIIRNYRTKKNLEDTLERDSIYELYFAFGLDYLVSLQRLLSDERLLKIRLRTYMRRMEKENFFESDDNDDPVKLKILKSDSRNEEKFALHTKYRQIERLYQDKIIKIQNSELFINQQFVHDLNEFVSYLKLI